MNAIAYLESPVGIVRIVVSNTALTDVIFVEEKTNDTTEETPLLVEAKQQLLAYFNGEIQVFTVPIEPVGTDFQKRVWNELLKIPYGKTISYLELAKRLGDEKVIRAAASANGKNPIGVIIPCHRVIGNDGKLVGYAGGLHRKRWLLALENKHANGVIELF